jgi:transcriptional regulator with XRE-family HTH domain
MMDTHKELRIAVKNAQIVECLSLRGLEKATGVSASTISRFLRGSTLSAACAQRLWAWVRNEPLPKKRKLDTGLLHVSGKTFFVTIEELLEA